MSYTPGLRERKKNATRSALAKAAFRIALAEGLSAATPERIASDAGVSTRTFHNYFPNRDTAVIYDYVDGSEHFYDIFMDRLRTQAVWTALCESFIQVIAERGITDEMLRQKEELIRSHPELIAGLAAQFDSLRARVSDTIAQHTGYDADSAETSLIAGSAVVAMRVGQEQWFAHPESDLAEQIRSAFHRLEQGLIASVNLKLDRPLDEGAVFHA